MKPTTIDEMLHALLGKPGKGTPKKVYELMTPTRWSHATELLQEGVDPVLVLGATNRIEASGWLQKNVYQVSEADLGEARSRAAAHCPAPPTMVSAASIVAAAETLKSVAIATVAKRAAPAPRRKLVPDEQFGLFTATTTGDQ